MNMIRYFSSAAEKSLLAQLRKKTGFSLVNCRNALNSCDNDLEKAEEWLKEQAKALGWKKAESLQMRKVPEGLVAVAKAKKKGIMVEVNCETDFVARNEKFQSLVQLVANACLKLPVSEKGSQTNKLFLNEQQLADLAPQNERLSEHVTKHIAMFGENIVLRRAICYETVCDDVEVAVDIHPPMQENRQILLGKYGSLVALRRHQKNTEVDVDMMQNLGVNLCKHIIGMNPIRIGNPDVDVPNDDAEEEAVLLHQEFLLNPDVTVAQVLNEHGADILDFERFECGEDASHEGEENARQRNADAN